MKILNAQLENFASYRNLEFDFQDKGLVLIHGANGSGKSTLCDAIPWILFGITAKGGKVDDVLSWHGGKTSGTVTLELNDKVLQVGRTRAPNDLIIWQDGGAYRGKDLADTQKRINELFGLDSALYLASAYFHEFSETSQFFTTTAKNRRTITEQLVDLSLPVKLQEKIKTQEKSKSTELNTLNNSKFTVSAKIEILSESAKEAKNSDAIWAHTQANRISTIEAKRDTYDITRYHKLKELENSLASLKYELPITYDLKLKNLQNSLPPESVPCSACGVPKPNLERDGILKEINDLKFEKQANSAKLLQHHDITKRVSELKDQANPYIEQLTEIKSQQNPHTNQLLKIEKEIEKNRLSLETLNKTEEKLIDDKLNLDLLSDAVTLLRSELVKNTIQDLESRTVSHLRSYFEGEISVEFTIQDNDKLEVLIRKDDNECSYTQLSKGQRQMLKLCFAVSVMECIQQHHALELKQLFFDESLDGMDDTNKLRAVKMLETLAVDRGTVYIVEHSEGVKAHIDNKYKVELIDGTSVLCQV